MQAQEIVSGVQASAGIDSPDHARHAVHPTLTVLGQRLSTQAGDLGGRLPAEFARCLSGHPAGQRFDVAEFYRRVTDEEGRGCTPEQARQHARAIVAVLSETLGSASRGLADQLLTGYADLVQMERADLMHTKDGHRCRSAGHRGRARRFPHSLRTADRTGEANDVVCLRVPQYVSTVGEG